MKILCVLPRVELVDSLQAVLLALADRGHHVDLAVPPRKNAGGIPDAIERHASIEHMACPRERGDEWTESAHVLRCARDYVRYLDPRYAASSRLRLRAMRMLVRAVSHGSRTQATGECPVCGAQLSGDHWGDLLGQAGEDTRAVIDRLLSMAEIGVPSDRSVEHFIESRRPDVVVVAPLGPFGSPVDYVKSAQVLGIPIVAAVVGIDDLSAEGHLHVLPDRLLVWNEHQRDEAVGLHGMPADLITVTGAPKFEGFAARRPAKDRAQHCASLGLDPSRRTLVFLGSSEFVAPTEPRFLERWLDAVRAGADDALRSCNIVVRPHPRNQPAYQDTSRLIRPGVAFSMADGEQGLFDCLFHADATAGINTGAFIEAALLGKPVRTVLVPEFSGTQEGTLHFQYLLRPSGGFVEVDHSLSAHVAGLSESLKADPTGGGISAGVRRFLGGTETHGSAVARTADVIAAAGRRAPKQTLRGWLSGTQPSRLRTRPIRPVHVAVDGLPVAGHRPPPATLAPVPVEPSPSVAGALPASLADVEAQLSGTDLSWLGTDETISEFWKHQIDVARQKAAAEGATGNLRVADVIGALGYGFKPLAPGVLIDEDPSFLEVLDAWRRARPLLDRSGSKYPGFTLDQWEHLSTIAWLEEEQLLDGYLAFIRPLRIKSSMASGRHFYRMGTIRHLCSKHLPRTGLSFLEVGAGAGNLAVFLLKADVAARYTIVDLPEMLLNAAVHLSQYCGDVDIHFDKLPAEVPPGPEGRRQIFLLRTTRITALPSDQFDVLLNFNSFMEMDESARNLYLREMHRTARDGALMYNVNRRQAKLPQPDGSLFDNNPLLYPYDPTDRLLFWEDDPFETAVRAWFGKRPSFSVARAALRQKRAAGPAA